MHFGVSYEDAWTMTIPDIEGLIEFRTREPGSDGSQSLSAGQVRKLQRVFDDAPDTITIAG